LRHEECDRRYVFDHNANSAREDYVTQKLVEFNWANRTASTVPEVASLPLQVTILDSDGKTRGGLIGRTHAIPQWLEVTVIWVDATLRGQGLGRRLMAEAEAEARQRGCRYARAITSNFQAPGFYSILGYELYGTLENCPPGETAFYFWKDLLFTGTN
jgi:ribosomal protein S18 acetylase RimI-like enzyme